MQHALRLALMMKRKNKSIRDPEQQTYSLRVFMEIEMDAFIIPGSPNKITRNTIQ